MTVNEKENEENKKVDVVEDTSAYYSQGDTNEGPSTDELYKPVPKINEEEEEMSFLKAMAFLGFGLGALSIVFILFFMHDLDERVVNMDSTVAKLDEKLEPFKKEISANVDKISSDVTRLEGKLVNYERAQAIMELKRTLVTVKEVTSETNSDVQSKSEKVVANIQALLQELEGKPLAPTSLSKGKPSGPTTETPSTTGNPAPNVPPVVTPKEQPVTDGPAEEPEQSAAAETSNENAETAADNSKADVGEIELVSEEAAEIDDEEVTDDEELVEDDD